MKEITSINDFYAMAVLYELPIVTNGSGTKIWFYVNGKTVELNTADKKVTLYHWVGAMPELKGWQVWFKDAPLYGTYTSYIDMDDAYRIVSDAIHLA